MQFANFDFLSGTQGTHHTFPLWLEVAVAGGEINATCKMATEIMAPLFLDINSRLTEPQRKEAQGRFCSVYGEKYTSHKDLVSLLNQCAKENKISPINTVPLLEGLTSSPEKRDEIGRVVERFKREQASSIKEWERHQPSEFVGRDIGWLGSILESHDCVVLWGKLVNKYLHYISSSKVLER